MSFAGYKHAGTIMVYRGNVAIDIVRIHEKYLDGEWLEISVQVQNAEPTIAFYVLSLQTSDTRWLV
jgi:hypothetical protein